MRGPLHGLPVLVKDNIATGDRMSTSGGSLALDGVRAPRDAHVVKRLRDAGAVILGKTNLSEWANIRSTRSTSGWSARRPDAEPLRARPQHQRLELGHGGGDRGRPGAARRRHRDRRLDRLAGVDLRPGRAEADGRPHEPRRHHPDLAHTQDTPGPMTRSVADAALLYAAMAGRDSADEATSAAPADLAPGAAIALPDDALRGARLGVARAYFTGFDEADALIEQAIVVLKRLGAEIVDPVDLASRPTTTPSCACCSTS